MTQASRSASDKWIIGGILLAAAVVGISVVDYRSENDFVPKELDTGTPPIETLQDTKTANTLTIPTMRELTRAANHVGRTMGAMGGEGAIFYSERCYEALEQNFIPPALDRCYGFDLLAERLIEEADAAFFYSWFWPENARARWDQAVLQSGSSQKDFATRRIALENEIESIPVALIEPPISPVHEKYAETTEAELGDTGDVAIDPSMTNVSSDHSISLKDPEN